MEAPVQNHGGFLMTVNSSSLLTALKLPEHFVKDHSNKLLNFASLYVPGGKAWLVQVHNDKDCVYFSTGWNYFAHHYSIISESKLTFTYLGVSPTGLTSRFRVKIYCPNGSEINYCAPKTDQFRPPNEPTQQQSGEPTEKPSFQVEIKTKNTKYNIGPVLPRAHCRKYYDKDEANCSIILSVHNKTWPIKLRFDKMDKLPITWVAGWGQFVFDNKLQAGDICVFQMIRFTPKTYDVRVRRVNDEVPTQTSEKDTSVLSKSKANGECKAPQVHTSKCCKPKKKAEKSDSFDMKSEKPRKSALERAKAFRSANPHFIVHISKRNLSYNSGPVLPRDHCRTHFKKDDHGHVILIVNKKRWTVKYRVEKMHKHCISMAFGWKKFAHGNKLHEGNVCVFEMIKASPNTYKVHLVPDTQTSRTKTAMKKKAEAFVGESPGFIKCMRRGNLHSMGVPPDHSKRYMKANDNADENFIKLVTTGEGSKPWKVQYCLDESCSTLRVGWILFTSMNRLEVGDYCAFKLVDEINKTYEVAIFRVKAK